MAGPDWEIGPEWRTADQSRSADVLAAARLAVLTGDAAAALRLTGTVLDRLRSGPGTRNAQAQRTEYRARFLAASAHDLLGAYPQADAVFHHHPLVVEQGTAPGWLPDGERWRLGLARARAQRLRGRYRDAVATLDQLLPEIQRAHPLGTHRGGWPVAMIEQARLQLLTGEVIGSRRTANTVIDVFTEAHLPRHPLCREAVTVLAESELTMALPEVRSRRETWLHATKQLRRALADSTEWYGPDNPLTLELQVLHGQSLHNNSQTRDALTVLADAENRITTTLGPQHPLALRARQWAGLARMGLADWQAAAGVFAELLPRQDAVLGRPHPESQLTRFQLGICLAKLRDLTRARPLIHESSRALAGQHGPFQQWALMARTAVLLTAMPVPAWSFFNAVEELLRKRRL
jgi:hypothetical protein